MNPRPFGVSLRVSSIMQRDKETIKTQEEEIRAWIRARGLDPDADAYWVRDEAVSGDVPLLERAGTEELTDLIENGYITEAVLVYAINRVNREDIPGYYYLTELCKEHGLSLRSISEGIDTATEWGEMMGDLRAWLSKHEKRDMIKRLVAGRHRKIRDGEWLVNPPYSHIKVGTRLEIDPLKERAIRDAWTWLVRERVSNSEVARRWEARGLPTARGGKWNGRRVQVVLASPALKGEAIYRRTRPLKRGGRLIRNVLRETSEHIVVPCPAIFTPAEWEQLQEALDANTATRRRTGQAARLFFLPEVYCAVCKARYYRQIQNIPTGTHRYYMHHWKGEVGKRPCRASSRADKIEEEVWQRIQRAVGDTDCFIEALRLRADEDAPDVTRAYQAATARLESLQAARQRLARALARGMMDEAVYDSEIAVVEREYRAASREAAHLKGQLEQGTLDERLGRLREFLAQVPEVAMGELPIDERRLICAALVERIELKKEGGQWEIRVVWRV